MCICSCAALLTSCAGPCISTDTACSSSLVATHLAHGGLLKRETVSALAAGVNIMLSPVTTVAICQLQVRTHWQCLWDLEVLHRASYLCLAD